MSEDQIPAFLPGEQLDRLLSPAVNDVVDALWSPAELPDVWEHELDSDAAVEAGYLGPIEAIECERLAGLMRPPARTVRDVLWHPSPDRRVLELLIERAARAAIDADRRLPEPIARLLEMMARAIRQPSDREALEAVKSMIATSWVPDSTVARLKQLVKE